MVWIVLWMAGGCFITGEVVQEASDPDGDGSPFSEDCANDDASVYPGAQERCGDGVVNDCEGSV